MKWNGKTHFQPVSSAPGVLSPCFPSSLGVPAQPSPGRTPPRLDSRRVIARGHPFSSSSLDPFPL